MAFNPVNPYINNNMLNNMNNMNFNNFNNFINMNSGMNMFNNNTNPMVLQWNMFLNQFYKQQMMNKINNQNQFDIWINQGNNNNKDRLSNLNQSVIANPFSQMPGPKINIIFQTVKGYKVTIPAPLNIPMQQVLVQYIIKIGLGPGALSDGFYFLFNGQKIDSNDENMLVGQLATTGPANIIVIDTKNLIGSML